MLEYVIGPEQTGFLKNRLISDNIRRTLEVVKYSAKNKLPHIILSLDFEKCFDKLEHESIRKSLEYFNYGPKFTQWVMLFFTELMIFTQNFGFLAPAFKKGRGSNQGCCISPFCYLLAGEILARKIKQNPNIKGVVLRRDIQILISQFADDTVLFLKFEKATLDAVV